MNRKNFILSWGRKLFFGISWPLSVLIGLLYLKGYIQPQSAIEYVYLITTFIGHFGLINALAYFLLFYPLISMFPYYYVARFWSLVLIVTINLIIFIDAATFSSYGIHFNKLIIELYQEEGIRSAASLKMIAAAFLFLGVVLWLRGEKIWRYMQTRFSNPIQNFYLGFMVLIIVAGQVIYYTSSSANIEKFSQIFPLTHRKTDAPEIALNSKMKSLNYPADVNCKSSENPNMLMIVLKEWEYSQFSKDLMPKTFHVANHGVKYTSHYSGGTAYDEGAFTLMYSIPASYMKTARENKTAPAIFTELKKRDYKIVNVEQNYPPSVGPKQRDDESLAQWKAWTVTQAGAENPQPFFGYVKLEQHALEADSVIHEIINDLKEQNILLDMRIVITGAYGGNQPGSKAMRVEELKVPFIIINPDRISKEVTHFTSHYDVMPSIMQKNWNCKDAHSQVSFGKPLEEDLKKDWFLLSAEDSFGILDFKTNMLTTIASKDQIYDFPMNEKATKPRHELVLEALKETNKLYRSK